MSVDQLHKTLERREATESRIIDALAHMTRDRALRTILHWFAISDLEEVAPTLIGPDFEIVANASRKQILAYRMAEIRRESGIVITAEYDKNAKRPLPIEGIEEAIVKFFREVSDT